MAVEYIPEVNFREAMREQFEFLIEHRGARCPPTCRECVRLMELATLLLKAFK